MPKWKDISRPARPSSHVSTSWEIQDENLLVQVVLGHKDMPPGMWCFHCRELGIDTEPLRQAHTAEEAKMFALTFIMCRLNTLQDSLKSFEANTQTPA